MVPSLWPVARWCELGTRSVRVHPLRLADLAALADWATRDGGMADPLAMLADAQAIAEQEARRRALAAAYDAADAAGMPFGDPAVQRVLGSSVGQARIVEAATRGAVDGLEALELVGQIAPGQWAAFDVVAWGADLVELAAAAIDREIGVSWPRGVPGKPGDFGAGLWTVVEATGWTLQTIGELTLSQWDWLRSGGKPGRPLAEPAEPPEGVGWDDFHRAVMGPRAAFWEAFGADGQP
jgi:hypothetical protein